MRLVTTLETAPIKSGFSGVLKAHGGEVTDLYDDGQRLYGRATLPWVMEIRPADAFHGGVAVAAKHGEVFIYPYLLRHVCTNGMIFTETTRLGGVSDLRGRSLKSTMLFVRKWMTQCCAKEVFAETETAVDGVSKRSSIWTPGILQDLSNLQLRYRRPVVRQFLDRLLGDRDNSPYGVMNGVTSLARDVDDPGLRWDLEVLGGEIAIGNSRNARDDLCTTRTHESLRLVG